MYTKLNEDFWHTVKLGNSTRMSVVGKGNVRLQMNGFNHVVIEVYYVPELKNNLMSIGQLQEKGLVILIKSGKCKILNQKAGIRKKN